MRKPLIAANWKMHPRPQNLDAYKPHDTVDVLVFPSFLDLKPCLDAGLHAGGQYGHPEDTGAYTGDISMKMLHDIGCRNVLCGHSERRINHGEDDAAVALQYASTFEHNLSAIVCVGETQEERDAGKQEEVVKRQVDAILPSAYEYMCIAYEPVWAIGTGNTATPKDAQEMHAFIRSLLPSPETSSVLYGGSMKPENAAELLSQPDIDGGLVGGASLDPEKFSAIVALAAASI
jgi:triosephosphate isomerase (TIM)